MDITVKLFTGIRFKAPRPPDHSTFRVANHQAEVTALVIFNSDVLIPAGNSFSLLSRESSRWQHVRFRYLMYLKKQKPLTLPRQGVWVYAGVG